MESKDFEYLARFESGLYKSLLDICSQKKLIGSDEYDVEELNDLWTKSAPDYMADAVPQIADYPMAATAWAGYFGIGAALAWDSGEDITKVDIYKKLCAERGWDCMDEYVTDLLQKSGCTATFLKNLEEAMQTIATTAITAIRKEGIEPQSKMAFHIFARTEKIVFKIGYCIALYTMGYKYTLMTIGKQC